ncbi:hypothetical protein TPHA_0G02190 [Tetrapisispora phaffii CBS 4417]|uniref:NFACT RNA-binding domain-containing protein n=1 Tax=Tetrapisispora phaffii (strain ATCC 24235 / CBS 4417 / NBRC 1672 / NRRL Y-8282 / UCD 70-5) TaxID=1071381 RepID=G8BVX7_TETPH|nr:hypothetical protein TPHA_0G02190 [Tetrapisispora phaffii CBS 4417]CCE64055.1 hypothetical protein TPHA_0G02190 [Tetrapisispora phaffii CBS 4417]
MVYFYTSQPFPDSIPHQIIVGKDKFENDLLIKYGYRELNYTWFHADNYSSGHVYLKLLEKENSVSDVSSEIVNDCLQLCKSESIQGNKLPQCSILITPWHNLRKNRFMKPGEVSFKSQRACTKRDCFARDTKIMNRLNKTRVELYEDVENILHDAKKSKNPNYFTELIANQRDELLESERLRKAEKKQNKKQQKKREEEWGEDIDSDEISKLAAI